MPTDAITHLHALIQRSLLEGYAVVRCLNVRNAQHTGSAVYMATRGNQSYILKCHIDNTPVKHEWNILQRLVGCSRVPEVIEMMHEQHCASKEGFRDAPFSTVLVLRYIEGDTLHSRYQHAHLQPFSESDVVRWLLSAARVMRDVHSANIQHLDLKPDNLIVQGTCAHVVDFGNAFDGDKPSLVDSVTHSCRAHGRYRPRGLCSADNQVDAARVYRDVFALCAILFDGLLLADGGRYASLLEQEPLGQKVLPHKQTAIGTVLEPLLHITTEAITLNDVIETLAQALVHEGN